MSICGGCTFSWDVRLYAVFCSMLFLFVSLSCDLHGNTACFTYPASLLIIFVAFQFSLFTYVFFLPTLLCGNVLIVCTDALGHFFTGLCRHVVLYTINIEYFTWRHSRDSRYGAKTSEHGTDAICAPAPFTSWHCIVDAHKTRKASTKARLRDCAG